VEAVPPAENVEVTVPPVVVCGFGLHTASAVPLPLVFTTGVLLVVFGFGLSAVAIDELEQPGPEGAVPLKELPFVLYV
jgi:hypothetical protein